MLVIHGGADTIMNQADSEAIAQIVNQSHPGHARYVQAEGMAHDFTVNGKFYDQLIPQCLSWMQEQPAAK